jgi:hypothetical protein
MGSLEQQMALFEELISQEQAPTNGILVPAQTLVSLAPGFIARPSPVVVASRPAGSFLLHFRLTLCSFSCF